MSAQDQEVETDGISPSCLAWMTGQLPFEVKTYRTVVCIFLNMYVYSSTTGMYKVGIDHALAAYLCHAQSPSRSFLGR